MVWKSPFVRVPARAVQNRVLGSEEAGDALLELAMNRLRPADEPDRREAVAVVALRLLRRLDDGRMIGEPEVVVRGQHDDLALAFDLDDRALGRLQKQLALQRAGGGHLIELAVFRVEMSDIVSARKDETMNDEG